MAHLNSMDIQTLRSELNNALTRLERYRVALRLAGVALKQRNQGIIALTNFAYQAGRITAPIQLLKLGLGQALEIANSSVGTIVLIDPATKNLALGIHRGLTPALRQVLTGQRMSQGAIALMPHLVGGSGALLEDNTDDEMERLLLESGRLSSLVSLPLQFGSQLRGALVIGLRARRYFKPAELYLLMGLSQEIALALENLYLREDLWNTVQTLLQHEDIELGEIPEPDLDIAVVDTMELPASQTEMPQPNPEDLEQLLTAMMEAEEEVQQQNADLQALNELAEMMNRNLDLSQILQCAVDQTRQVLKTDAAWIYLVNEKKQLEMRAHNGLSAGYVRGMGRLEPGDGLEGQVVVQNEARFIATVATEFQSHKIWIDKEGLQALAAMPIYRPERENRSQSTIIGVLGVGKQVVESYTWNSRDIRLLNSIATQMALAIDNARLYARVREDQIGLQTGNEILRTINDTLLEKNANLEQYLQQKMSPALNKIEHLLDKLQTKNQPEQQAEEVIASLQMLVHHLKKLSDETEEMTQALDTQFEQILRKQTDRSASTR